jgi:energy-coupling factor transporter ATP-binding protein EcfA2
MGEALMRVRQLEISHYRGIEDLKWSIPKDRGLICLVGPGDSGKSTLLDALNLVLGDRWNPAIADTDFFNCDSSSPIVIRCVVSGLPASLLKDSAFGLWLSGIEDSGALLQDPIDGTDAALIVQVRIDETLEPVWTVERVEGDYEGVPLKSGQRREFATFKVDDRIDPHLRWTRTSALGRISAGSGTSNAMALANRAAREAIACYVDPNLHDLTERVQTKLNKLGCGSFQDIHPGLDTSLSSSSGNLALYESKTPLTNYGLGSKRLAALAVQQLASVNKAILLVDEIEHGLEPHRLVRLLQYLLSDASYSQVFVTTHSPVAVEQASTENLAVVRNDAGSASVHFLPDGQGTALRMRRLRPSSFLARRIIVTEGKTEEGIVLEVMDRTDADRLAIGLSIAAGEGTVVQDGQGGSDAALRAKALKELGYATALMLDNDDRTVDKAVAEAEAAGVVIVRWAVGKKTEDQLVASLDAQGLSSLLKLGTSVRHTEATVMNDLRAAGLPPQHQSLFVGEWLADDKLDLETARQVVSEAMSGSKWFKSLDASRLLGSWIMDHLDDFSDNTFITVIAALKAFIYLESDAAPEAADGDA